jgi:hypothetical protein
MTDNPLADFVELPDEFRPLRYSNLLPGVIRGALEMVCVVEQGARARARARGGVWWWGWVWLWVCGWFGVCVLLRKSTCAAAV